MEESTYLTSTQHRLFTYTPSKLSALRMQTNLTASQKITSSILSARAAAAAAVAKDSSDSNGEDKKDVEIETLTASEELKLISYYCIQCLQLSDHFQFPSNVKATALTYLHRLYLTTSAQSLHPKKLLLPILYLATKTENHYVPLKTFVETAATAGLKTTKEAVLAPEFSIAMGLRWAFQVWHPFRGLEGIFLELNAIYHSSYAPSGGTSESSAEARRKLLSIAAGDELAMAERITKTYGEARKLLTTTALLTDVYFLYTPPQISFAALYVADEALALFYLDLKFPPSPMEADAALKEKLLSTIIDCAKNHLIPASTRSVSDSHAASELLRLPTNGIPTNINDAEAVKAEVVRIDKKLYHLTKALKSATEAIAKAVPKEEGDDKAVKKRKMERERSEREGDVFGGTLLPVGVGAGSNKG
ncbi:hypothetical protein RUND412_006653 [Rhizina undulata]